MYYKIFLFSLMFPLFASSTTLRASEIKAEVALPDLCRSATDKKTKTFPVELSWLVFNEIFYNDYDFLDLKHAALFSDNDNWISYGFERKHYYGDLISPLDSFDYNPTKPLHPDLGKYLEALNTRSTVTEKKLIRAYLAGAEWKEAGQYLLLNPRVLMSELGIDLSFPIVFKKNITASEACLLLNTLRLEIEVSYVVYEIDPSDNSKKIRVEKKSTVTLTALEESVD